LRAGLSHGRSRPFVGSLVALAVLAGLGYRRLLFWDPSAPGLPDVGWFFFGMHDTAPQIVFAIGALLLYRRRRRLAQALARRGSPLPALPLLGAGLALFLWAHYVDAPDLLLLSFLPFCLGSALLLFGAGFAREMALPILFLAFALPIPGVLTNQIVFPLQLWNAELVAQLLNVAGIPVVQEGDVLSFPDRSFEIIETCSGLRAIVVLSMVAVAWACYFPARRLHLALLVASACLIACCLNAARIVTVVLRAEPDPLAPHAFQGAVLFLGGGAALWAVDAVLRRWLGARTIPARVSVREGAVGKRHHIERGEHVIALALVLALMLGASIWMPRWSPPESQDLTRIRLPEEIGGWEAIETLKPDRFYLGSVRLQEHRYRRYRRDGETLSAFVGYEDRLSRSRSLLSPKTVFPGRGWQEEERALVEIGPDGFPGVGVVARSQSSRMLSLHWHQGVEGLGTEVLRAWLAIDRSFLRRPAGALVIRLSTEVSSIGKGRSRAEARLREFAELLLARFSDFDDGARAR
jgi:EpsI family protein